MTVRPVLETAPWVTCSKCGIVQFDETCFEQSFAQGFAECPKCRDHLNWWDAVCTSIRDHFVFGQTMLMAGARTLVLEVMLAPGGRVKIRLQDFGVPDDAEVVHLNVTAQGSISPLLLHGNNVIRDPFGPEFYLYGRPMPDSVEGEVGVSLLVTWFVRRADDTVQRHLVDAARQFTAGRFDAVVIPANIAAEAALSPVVTKVFEGFAGRENLDRFLRDAATYSHQLNVLLAVAAELLRAPKFPDEIRGVLNRLRRLRNDIAHDGACANQSQGEAAEHIAAAIFLVQYAALLRKKLGERVAVP